MPSPYSPTQWSRITSSLVEYSTSIGHRTNKVWFKAVDVEAVAAAIWHQHVPSAIVADSYLVVFSTGKPWYAPSVLCLEEHLVLRLPGASAPFSVVTDFLKAAGVERGASYVMVGTALAHSDKALSRMYEREGFDVQAVQLGIELVYPT